MAKKKNTHKELNPPYSSFNNAVFSRKADEERESIAAPPLFMEMAHANDARQYKSENNGGGSWREGSEQRRDVCICGTVVVTCRVTS